MCDICDWVNDMFRMLWNFLVGWINDLLNPEQDPE